ncbi:UDP-N-acetylmuramoyl-tripeptide--D-alanyl-D-alanine ligase [Subdoligranulum sp. DSM 109015]|uniref:UDP-N-acetylmuramoyl-tripeptide--D-alanyl-D-alanine ligase n=1 Tax=Gemmiger gallinarum TaxID=2779354 RepID=A0ABR9R113_9FIRM|nr:UDP-N-acetylmuramoyl-tripeptide--D-alanyl-D-alanine ligase [Gemmiger gallinarum]MBE5036836.1 UDP-N-acetylmuramoyl-tripeptide--D-alanyl-D-alanine ligase [Gemmiger gallinarum]
MKPIHANQLLAGLALAEPDPITEVVTDSRKVVPGCVFVCFPGERVDGHDYAAAAYRAGASYIIANHPVEGVPEDRTVIVPSSHHAMVRMASNYRMLFSPLMIGVTGSVGKTTTKEFCYAVLSAFGNTLKTEGNQNNEIGLPNTLFRLDDATEYAVVEMGMSNLGEIERLTRAARPAAGIITRIGVSHLENLGSRENILKAKLEICYGLPDGAPLVLNADDDMLPKAKLPGRLRPVWFGIDSSDADVRALNITAGDSGTDFLLSDREYGEFPVHIPTVGLHTVSDALAAYGAATRLGLDPARCAAALSNYQTTGMRQNIVRKAGITIIEDCYNASPDSMRAALGVLESQEADRHIALLGDMLELGSVSEEAHRQVGEWAAEAGVDLLIAYGPRSAAMAQAAAGKGVTTLHCETEQEVVGYVRQNVHAGDALLAKASHAMKLDQVLEQFYKTLA